MARFAHIAALAPLLFACGPHLNDKPVTTRTYAAQSSCGQNLVETSFTAQGARWGESLTVYACGARDISGHVEVDVEFASEGRMTWNGSFGSGSDNARCVARDVEAAVIAEQQTDSPTTTAAEGSPTATRSTPASPASKAPQAFREILWSGEVCRHRMRTMMDLGKLKPGSIIKVKLWSASPTISKAQ